MGDYEVLDRQEYGAEGPVSYPMMSLKSLKGPGGSDDGRLFSGVLNANQVDREGERFDPAGVDIRGFKRAGGPILTEHFSEQTANGLSSVVARAITIVTAPEGVIIRKAEFDIDVLSEHWMGKVHRKFVRGLSAGLLKMSSELRQSKKDGAQHVVVTKSELIHAILTSQPVNVGSLIAAKSLDRIAALETAIKGLSTSPGGSSEVLEELATKMAELSDQVATLSEQMRAGVAAPASAESNDAMGRLADAAAALAHRAFKAARPELPDAAFIIEIGAERNSDGTVVRKFRHLPHHTGSVKSSSENTSINKALLRNALARVNQVKSTKESAESYQARATRHLRRHADAVGIGTDD